MKKIKVVVMLLFVCLSSEAQKFLRYQMKNNSYYGFYTNGIGSILHDYKNGIATTFINVFGKVYEIPINNIDSISVEDVIIANGDVGQYKIYEFNYDEGDVRKIYVDNRASLFASHNGDFGANDTILFSSAYNDIAWLFYTDDKGRIKKFFDGERLLFFDNGSDSEFTILDLSTGTTYPSILTKRYLAKSYRATSPETSCFFRSLSQRIHQTHTQSTSSASNLANNIDVAQNDPELHNQRLIYDWSLVGIDAYNAIMSALEVEATGGLSLIELGNSVRSLYNNTLQAINEAWPDNEQMKRYTDYYQKKYNIIVAALSAENVSYASATLHGHATSTEGFNGSFSFTLYGETNEKLTGEPKIISDDWCKISANASKLKPGWPYFYSVQYACVVDGLKLVFNSGNIAEFMTLSPTVYTGEIQSISSDRVEVTCQFYNFPEGSICGVEYSCNDVKEEKRADATHEGEYYFTLTPLKPNTTYTYQAFVVIDGVYVYAEEIKQFKIDSENIYSECPDENHPHWIDLRLPSGTLWSCCNVGASSPEEVGGYFTYDQATSAPTKEQIEELIKYASTTKSQKRNGVNGFEFRGPFRSSIFLPATDGFIGSYWSSTSDSHPTYGWNTTTVNCYFLGFNTNMMGSVKLQYGDVYNRFNEGVYSDPIKRTIRLAR